MDQALGSSTRDVLDPPVRGGHGLTTAERQAVDLSRSIPGWGSDLDSSRRPGVPRDKAPEIGVESLYAAMPQQQPPHTIHKSTEHAKLTPVFGTSCPPRGLSGVLRGIGYKYSEGRLARWLTLLFADRVDMVEGIVSDLARLHIPNIPREMGLGAELKYNREAFLRKSALVAGGFAVALIAWGAWRRR
jgi:hypothetical protein